jgi:serine/threonine protein kinase/tetratricopeptide (TPR) repeat protein
MSAPFGDAPEDLNSTREILEDWNLGQNEDDGPTPGSASTPSAARDGSGIESAIKPFPLVDRELGSEESVGLCAGFEVGPSGESWSSSHNNAGETVAWGTTRKNRHRADSPPPAPGQATHLRPEGGRATNGSRGRKSLPHPGDEFAGFRIILELGRGAFARVYLAEEIRLGRRLVAIKVSQPEGEEPQILARLQHTHIVPVHSVHDDQSSGWRILCMPYFGGANLAQVLAASGGLVPTQHAGRSLVEALDQISRSLPAIANQGSVGEMRPLASAQSNRSLTMVASSLPGRLEKPATVSRVRSFFSRLVGTPVPMPAACPVPIHDLDQDRHEPSRQFLCGASAIQAAVWIMARLAEGLDHAHSRGLLHRDLKPANILLSADGTPMLLDFNLAAQHRGHATEGEVRRAMVGGTLPYMSPEHLDAFNPRGTTPPECVDERSDIYALGLILFEMLAGEPPFPAPPHGTPVLESLQLMIESRRQVPALRAQCPQVPWSLDALVTKCLEFEPARRYVRAGDLAEDLRRFLENLPMKHCPEPSVRERMGKFAKRHPGLCGSTSIALMALVLLGVLGWTVVFGLARLQDLYARLRLRDFNRDFTESQFLLNTGSDSDDHLRRGIRKAHETFAYLDLAVETPSLWGGWYQRLRSEERRRVQEQVVELMLLEARAQVLVATKRGSEADRRRAIEHAIARLGRAERIGPHPPAALFAERARYYDALGEARLADGDRQRAADMAPSTSHDWTLMGTTLLSAGDQPGAEEALRQALQRDYTSFWSWFLLGHCHYAQERFLEAAGDFAVCTALGPEFAWTHFNRGLALARAGRLLDAKDAYDRALELQPKFAEALADRALVELELNQLEAARDDLIRARELGRTELAVTAALGETYARLGRRTDAERFFAALLAKNPDDPVARVARGMSRVHTDPAGAKSDFSEVLQQDPRHSTAHYGLALLIRGTDPQAALGHLDTALQSDPNLIDAIQLRALVLGRLGSPAVLEGVNQLIESPTSRRLYNAACAMSLYAEKAHDSQQVSRAMGLLARALKAGFPASEAVADPDLRPLRTRPEFQQLLAGASKSP